MVIALMLPPVFTSEYELLGNAAANVPRKLSSDVSKEEVMNGRMALLTLLFLFIDSYKERNWKRRDEELKCNFRGLVQTDELHYNGASSVSRHSFTFTLERDAVHVETIKLQRDESIEIVTL